MTPAIACQSEVPEDLGRADHVNGQVYYGCQLWTPPTGPCYGPDQIRAAYGIQPLLNQH